MNVPELQDLLADKLGRTEAAELVRYIKHRPEYATKQYLRVLSAEMK